MDTTLMVAALGALLFLGRDRSSGSGAPAQAPVQSGGGSTSTDSSWATVVGEALGGFLRGLFGNDSADGSGGA